MNKETLNSLILEPNQTVTVSSDELVSLVNEYPYFQAAHVLLLHNFKITGNCLFDEQLLTSALQIADRNKLYNLLNSLSIAPEFKALNESATEQPRVKFQTIREHADFQLEENQPVESLAEDQFHQPSDLVGEKSELLDLEETNIPITAYPEEVPNEIILDPATDTITPVTDRFSLIDKFLEDIPVFTPVPITEDQHPVDVAYESIKEDVEVVTETLAAIYMNQQLFEKAIGVYEKLILKNPEKSTYFASRIEEIKKLIK